MANFESILDQINSNIDKEVNLFNYELEKVLRKAQNLVEVSAVQFISDPLRFDYEVMRILKDAGYYDLIDSFINQSYDKNYAAIADLFTSSGLSATFTSSDLSSINALKAMDLEFFNSLGKEAAQRLKRDLMKYSLSDIDVSLLTSNIAESLADTPLTKHSKTYAETAISNFNQSLMDLKTEGAEGAVYIYSGVTDKKTRKFCKCLMSQDKYYDSSDAGSIKSDKRRQYNCRHLVIPVSLDYALRGGYTSGSFTC